MRISTLSKMGVAYYNAYQDGEALEKARFRKMVIALGYGKGETVKMASVRKRGKKYIVIYSYLDPDGKRKQKWETYATKAEEIRRKKEIEYKGSRGPIVIPPCKELRELLREFVDLYGKFSF